jgi:hypothetical protein
MSRREFIRWVMLWIVPAIALAVAARQVYLSRTADLSTWKGGGMGMFAGADNTFGRYAKIYVLMPNGQRMPLLRLSPSQDALLRKSLLYPSEANFRALAESIKTTTWWAGTDELPLGIFDESGAKVSVDESVRFHEIRPAPLRSQSETLKFSVVIEYWKADYDVSTGDMRAVLARTFMFRD